MTGSIVLQGKEQSVRLRNTRFADGTVVLVDVVAKMDNIVVLILARSIAIRVEVSVGFGFTWSVTLYFSTQKLSRLTEIAARENCKAELRDVIVLGGSGLGTPNGALVVRSTNVKLIPVLGLGTQSSSFNLFQSVNTKANQCNTAWDKP